MPDNIGRVVQVIGPVIDIEFDPEELPEISTAVRIKSDESVDGIGGRLLRQRAV